LEADWEFEVGGDAPAIDACWAGFVDLRQAPKQARILVEVGDFPPLAVALEKLNSPSSPVWTSKCDFRPELEPGDFDPDELDAPPGCSGCAVSCYIDILPREGWRWTNPQLAEAACRELRGLLAAIPLRCSRVDLVVRRAIVVADRVDLGITAYVTACGSGAGEARNALASALFAFVDALCTHSTLQ